MTNLFIEFKAQRLRVQIRSTLRLTALPGTNTGAAHLLWAHFASWAPWSVWGWLNLLRDCSGNCGLPQVCSVSSHSQHLTVQISVTFLLSTSSLGLVFSPAKPPLRLRERALTRSPLPSVTLSHCALEQSSASVTSVLASGTQWASGSWARHYTGLALYWAGPHSVKADRMRGSEGK